MAERDEAAKAAAEAVRAAGGFAGFGGADEDSDSD